MLYRLFITLTLFLILPTLSLAHRKARTVVDEGKPINIWVQKGKKTLISFPEAIMPTDAPIRSSDLELKMAAGNDTTLVALAHDIDEPVMMSVPTLDGVYILNIIPHKNGDTYVTVQAKAVAKPESAAVLPEIGKLVKIADEAPLLTGVSRLFHAMYGVKGTGVRVEKTDVVVCDKPEEYQLLIRRYHYNGLKGMTIWIENRRPQSVTINHAGLREHQQDSGFYASSLSNTAYQSVESIAPGDSAFLHLIFLGESYE